MKSVATYLLLLINLTCFGQLDVKPLLDSVIFKAKQISLYSSTVNWDTLQKNIYAKAENAKTINDLKPAFETLLNGLKDFHGSILNARDYSTIARFTDYEHLIHPDKRVRAPDIWKAVNDTSLHFQYEILKDNIGYLKIVGIAPNVDIEKESQKIRNAVIKISENKVKKWILDLRYNGGGNMHPMMAGLGPLIGEGIVGKLVNFKEDMQFN